MLIFIVYIEESRCFGFVKMSHKDDAAEAVKNLDGYRLDGRALRVEIVRNCQKLRAFVCSLLT